MEVLHGLYLQFSSNSAYLNHAGSLIGQDHMLQSMPNVVLALHLLNESYSKTSFWKPYIGWLSGLLARFLLLMLK